MHDWVFALLAFLLLVLLAWALEKYEGRDRWR